MKKYEAPVTEIIALEQADVITTSGNYKGTDFNYDKNGNRDGFYDGRYDNENFG